MALPGTSAGELPGSAPRPGSGLGSSPLGPSLKSVSNAPTALQRVHPPVTLRLETSFGSNRYIASNVFDWRGITEAMDGGDTTATIAAGLDASKLTVGGSVGDQHFADLIRQLSPDRRIRISQGIGRDRVVYFQGFPQTSRIIWNEKTQEVDCTCLSEGQERLRGSDAAQITGRLLMFDPLERFGPWDPEKSATLARNVSALPAIFNAQGLPNRTATAFPVDKAGGQPVHLFTEDNAPEAKFWTFAQALRYVVIFYVFQSDGVSPDEFLLDTKSLAEIEPPSDRTGGLSSTDPIVRLLTARVNDLSITSTNAEEAIAAITESAGLHYEIPIRAISGGVDWFLRVFEAIEDSGSVSARRGRRMGKPKLFDIAREAPFSDGTGRSDRDVAIANRAAQVDLTIDRRGINRSIFLGGDQLFEVTLLLRPGWMPTDKLDVTEAMIDADETDQTRACKILTMKRAAMKFWRDEFSQFDANGQPKPDLSVYHGNNPDHASVADVGRLWIFPDDWRWFNADGTSDYERIGWSKALYSPYFNEADPEVGPPDFANATLVLVDPAIGGDLFQSKDWVPRRRPFGELIGRIELTGDRRPVVRLNFSETDPRTALASTKWVRYSGGVHIDPDRASITLTEPNLLESPLLNSEPEFPANGVRMIEAYLGLTGFGKDTDNCDDNNGDLFGEPSFMVSVTCTIRGDDRLSFTATPGGASFTRRRSQVVDLGRDRFVVRNRRGQNSSLNTQAVDGDPRFEDRNDKIRLVHFALDTSSEMVQDVVSGSVESFWIDPSYRIGDVFEGASGLDLHFDRNPMIIRTEYINSPGAGFRTVLHLSDLRGAPEVGTE